jgi:hypothetical protein
MQFENTEEQRFWKEVFLLAAADATCLEAALQWADEAIEAVRERQENK